LTTPLRRPDSRAERIQSLVFEKLDGLSRQPYAAEHEVGALSRLKPHMETELEALETLEWLRDLTDEELARRRAFAMVLSVLKRGQGESRPKEGRPSTKKRILGTLRLGAATNHELQEFTGASAGAVRYNLCELIREGEVVAEGGCPITYRLS